MQNANIKMKNDNAKIDNGSTIAKDILHFNLSFSILIF